MYVSSPNSEYSSCFTIDSDKLFNGIVETFKAHKDHLTTQPVRGIRLKKVKQYGIKLSTNK